MSLKFSNFLDFACQAEIFSLDFKKNSHVQKRLYKLYCRYYPWFKVSCHLKHLCVIATYFSNEKGYTFICGAAKLFVFLKT